MPAPDGTSFLQAIALQDSIHVYLQHNNSNAYIQSMQFDNTQYQINHLNSPVSNQLNLLVGDDDQLAHLFHHFKANSIPGSNQYDYAVTLSFSRSNHWLNRTNTYTDNFIEKTWVSPLHTKSYLVKSSSGFISAIGYHDDYGKDNLYINWFNSSYQHTQQVVVQNKKNYGSLKTIQTNFTDDLFLFSTVQDSLTVTKVSNKGIEEWSKKHYLPRKYGHYYSHDIVKTVYYPDGSITVIGNNNSNNQFNLFLLNLSKFGELVWYKTYPSSFSTKVEDALIDHGGRLVLLSNLEYPDGNGNPELLFFDQHGNQIRKNRFEAQQRERAVQLIETYNSYYLIGEKMNKYQELKEVFVIRKTK